MVNHDTELNKNWTPETSRRCSEIQKIINTEVAICTTTIKFRNPLVCITIGFHILRRKKKKFTSQPIKKMFYTGKAHCAFIRLAQIDMSTDRKSAPAIKNRFLNEHSLLKCCIASYTNLAKDLLFSRLP